MSNVLARHRSISSMEFYSNAADLRDDMTKFLMREKNVPRKYRAIATYPIVEAFEELLKLIKEANYIYINPKDEHVEEKRKKRKALQQKCIYKVDEIYGLLQRTVGLLWKDTLRSPKPSADTQRLRNALNDFAKRLVREEELLTGWRESKKNKKKE